MIRVFFGTKQYAFGKNNLDHVYFFPLAMQTFQTESECIKQSTKYTYTVHLTPIIENDVHKYLTNIPYAIFVFQVKPTCYNCYFCLSDYKG